MDFDALRRWPDIGADGLRAFDAADRLILDEAAVALRTLGALGTAPGVEAADASGPAPRVAVIGDTHGALALGAASDHGLAVRAHQDALLGERAIVANAERLGLAELVAVGPLGPALVAGARVVLLRLPRSLDALDEQARLIAEHADPDVVVVAGGRLKHMTVAMNDVLLRWFERVDVSHARQKSRVLLATGPRRDPAGDVPGRGLPGRGAPGRGADAWPRRSRDEGLGIEIVAHGGVFAGASVDIGTRFLLASLGLIGSAEFAELVEARLPPTGSGSSGFTAVDLACGTGIVAVELARRLPDARIVATDQSAAAAASARETAAANGVGDRVEVLRADGLEFAPEASVDLVVLNPPFHAGPAVTTALAERLFADAGRALAPGGRLVAVWNSHLRYRPALERLVGPTRQLARDPKFTVTVSVREGG